MDRGNCAYQLIMRWAMRSGAPKRDMRRKLAGLFAELVPAKA